LRGLRRRRVEGGIRGKEETRDTTKSAASERRRRIRRRRFRIIRTVTIQPKETTCGFTQINFSHPSFDFPTQQTNPAAGQ
jgi:hypothetical protein